MKTLKVLLYFSSFLSIVMAQISWTPIFVDGNSQVDLWTHEAKGCRCSFDSKRQDCACCAKDGGCPCGRDSPHRCTQCGLEDYCSNLCNVTLDSRVLSARSGKTFGQLKSPSIEGPGMCYYVLQPMPGQRIELQVYRLVSAGHFNGSSCQGGFLQLVDGAVPLPSRNEVQICGENGRYAPPIVLFADNGPATLIFQITEETVRSQFLAYFSFTSVTSSQGIQYKGGRRIENTECDWLYQDYACRAPGSCVLASPGYPGLYPPHRRCKYHIAISSIQTKVKISFNSLLLPQNQCTTDYIAIYQGTLSSSPLLTKLCGSKKEELTYSGPNLFLEFSSGPPVPPYDYNGFKATLEFSEKPTSTESSINFILKTTETGVLKHVDGTLKPSTLCDVDYYGLSSASHGQVTNPGTQDLYFNIQRHLKCVQRFIPAANQSITLTVGSYQKLQPDPDCHTQCGDFGCRCVTSLKPLAQVDHLLFQTESGQTLTCLCGDFLNEWLPVTIQSWSPIKLVYSVAHYSWETKGFNFTANYTFVTDGICGHHTLTSPDGEIKSIRIIPDGQLNYFYHQRCTWLLDTKVERQLNLELYTAQNHNCHAWNVTIHHYDESSSDRAGQIIETFCPRHRQKKYELPWKTDLVVIKLQATTQKPPEFTLRWRSQVFRSNNRIADPSPAPGSATPLRTIFPCIFLLITYILARFVHS